MFNLLRSIRLPQKVNSFVPQRTLSKRVTHQYFDATPEEIDLVNRRLKLRQALRAEYLRKSTDPHSTDPIVFDPLMQRYYSMHMTLTDRFVPTFKNWCIYMLSSVVPVIILAQIFRYKRSKFERKCRSGEISYKDRWFKHQ